MASAAFVSRAVIVAVLLSTIPAMPAVSDDDAEFRKALDASESGDYAIALKILPKLGRDGHAGAQQELGDLLFIAAEESQSDVKATGMFQLAASWYRLAAEQGMVGAQYNLGIMYRDGYGIAQDYAEALSWFRLAAEQGHSDAQHNLGVFYDDGEGVPQDHAEAVSWWLKSAEQGNAESQYSLGNNYTNGEGVPRDHAAAASWYRKAAEQGQVNAQYNLGHSYSNGLGVPEDIGEAIFWYRKAAEQGHSDAKHNLEIVLQRAAES